MWTELKPLYPILIFAMLSNGSNCGFGEKGLLSVCLFWNFSSHSGILNLFGDVTIAGEELQNFDLCSALMAIERWGFISLQHLWLGHPFIMNGHLRGPVTLSPNAERLAVKLSLHVLTTKVCRGWDSNTQSSACGANALSQTSICAIV